MHLKLSTIFVKRPVTFHPKPILHDFEFTARLFFGRFSSLDGIFLQFCSVFFFPVCVFFPRSLVQIGKISDSKQTIYFKQPNVRRAKFSSWGNFYSAVFKEMFHQRPISKYLIFRKCQPDFRDHVREKLLEK